MNIELDLEKYPTRNKVGQWRDLTKRELQELNRLCEGSRKTIE